MPSQWFETFFQGVAVEFWSRVVPPAATLADVDFLQQAFGTPQNLAVPRILDVPCGNGRHAIELARRGYRVTAIDISGEFLDRARHDAAEANISIDFLKGDMRSLALPQQEFAGAYCLGNSIGYLDRASAQAFLASLSQCLRPHSPLVIETGCAAESILPSFQKTRWHRAGDIVLLSEARYAAAESRVDIDYTFLQGAVSDTRSTSSYVLTTAELTAMLVTAGFSNVSFHGGVRGESFEVGSSRLIVVAQRE